jgi:acyl-CoA synthetase (AMP-forming)/AMP-acid ligase II
LFRGYYRRDDLTAEVFDADGFYRTGDIVAELGPDRLRYVDRRNNLLKLSQGEFVAVSRLWRRSTATASWCGRSTCTATASDPTFSRWWCRPTERSHATGPT